MQEKTIYFLHEGFFRINVALHYLHKEYFACGNVFLQKLQAGGA